ncbi:substrate-binding domain-containing protein [Streptococcus ictaluri]|uniref:Transcriptional regulator LacI/GalR-like sensor domain-containing protein n=1 Tax=Streptococcus ictaluri 707-05 TaxID=764299 RepID=G5JZT8_9STRE|nr:substrate-binding domain-containing protein [Streptococcus ictaluri]EHI70740.1 hypothetical protein STRIC_0802 [Streptococcus ictaluri 707-05]
MPFTLYTSPKLTTIHQETSQKAQLAIDSLLALLHGKNIPTKQVLPVALIERESSASPRLY